MFKKGPGVSGGPPVSPWFPDCGGISIVYYFCFILKWFTIWSTIFKAIHFISVIILQTCWCNRTIVTIFIDMPIWRSSALSVNMLLMFYMHNINGVSFLIPTSFSALSFAFAAVAIRSIVPFTTIYVSL